VGGKAGDVPDDPAAQRKDVVAALDMVVQQPVDNLGKLAPAFRLLACGEFKKGDGDARCLERIGQARSNVPGNMRISDRQYSSVAGIGRQPIGGLIEQAIADPDIIRLVFNAPLLFFA
jgi:hypothetical protein